MLLFFPPFFYMIPSRTNTNDSLLESFHHCLGHHFVFLCLSVVQVKRKLCNVTSKLKASVFIWHSPHTADCALFWDLHVHLHTLSKKHAPLLPSCCAEVLLSGVISLFFYVHIWVFSVVCGLVVKYKMCWSVKKLFKEIKGVSSFLWRERHFVWICAYIWLIS